MSFEGFGETKEPQNIVIIIYENVQIINILYVRSDVGLMTL